MEHSLTAFLSFVQMKPWQQAVPSTEQIESAPCPKSFIMKKANIGHWSRHTYGSESLQEWVLSSAHRSDLARSGGGREQRLCREALEGGLVVVQTGR